MKVGVLGPVRPWPELFLPGGPDLALCQGALEGGATKASSTTLGLIFLFLILPLTHLQVLSQPLTPYTT